MILPRVHTRFFLKGRYASLCFSRMRVASRQVEEYKKKRDLDELSRQRREFDGNVQQVFVLAEATLTSQCLS